MLPSSCSLLALPCACLACLILLLLSSLSFLTFMPRSKHRRRARCASSPTRTTHCSPRLAVHSIHSLAAYCSHAFLYHYASLPPRRHISSHLLTLHQLLPPPTPACSTQSLHRTVHEPVGRRIHEHLLPLPRRAPLQLHHRDKVHEILPPHHHSMAAGEGLPHGQRLDDPTTRAVRLALRGRRPAQRPPARHRVLETQRRLRSLCTHESRPAVSNLPSRPPTPPGRDIRLGALHPLQQRPRCRQILPHDRHARYGLRHARRHARLVRAGRLCGAAAEAQGRAERGRRRARPDQGPRGVGRGHAALRRRWGWRGTQGCG